MCLISLAGRRRVILSKSLVQYSKDYSEFLEELSNTPYCVMCIIVDRILLDSILEAVEYTQYGLEDWYIKELQQIEESL